MASSATSKPEVVSEFAEYNSFDEASSSKPRLVKTLDMVRLALTLLALLSAVAVLGTAGDALANYNRTTLGSEYIISIWPNEFDIRPTTALVVCAAIVLVSSLISLAGFAVSAIQTHALLNAAFSLGLPTINLIAALIGTSFFYGVNASNTNFSLQSWSCQWAPIQMDTKPHWGTLCKQSQAALYLTVMWIPLELIILGTAAFGSVKAKKTESPAKVLEKRSPTPSS